MNATTHTLAFIEGVGGPEMIMVMVIVMLLFGGKKLPEFARGLGKSVREFKKATSGVEEEFRRAIEEEPETPPVKPKAPATTPAVSPAVTPKPTPPPADDTTGA